MIFVHVRDIPPYEYEILPMCSLRAEISQALGRMPSKSDHYCQGLLPNRVNPGQGTLEPAHVQGENEEFLEEKIDRVFKSLLYREREIIKLRNGLCDGYTYTLEELGQIFHITRERVRQIEANGVRKLQKPTRSCALKQLLGQVLDFVATQVPAPADEIESKLARIKVTNVRFPLPAIVQMAELLGCKLGFRIELVNGQPMALPLNGGPPIQKIIHIASKLVRHYGVASIAEVTAQVAMLSSSVPTDEFVTRILAGRSDFRWLDKREGWFWLRSLIKNRLVSRIRKIVAVAGGIDVSELRAGIARHYLMKGYAPPRRILLALCNQLPGYRVEGTVVIADPPLDWREILRGTEHVMVEVLKEHGEVLQRSELEEICVGYGVKRSTFYVYLGYSPIIERYAPGVYGLRGAVVPPGLIEELAPEQRRGNVLLDHGWTSEGKIWIKYSLSDAMISSGVFSVPSAMKRFLDAEFVLKAADGVPMGALVVRSNGAWGLSPFFRRRGGEAGDPMTIVFDLSSREAVVSIGEDTPLEDSTFVSETSATYPLTSAELRQQL